MPLTARYQAAFHAAHRARYGYADAARAVEVVNLRLTATVAARVRLSPPPPTPRRRRAAAPPALAGALAVGATRVEPRVLAARPPPRRPASDHRAQRRPPSSRLGGAPGGWRAATCSGAARGAPPSGERMRSRVLSPADLQIAHHRLAAVAEEMGLVLCRSAFSPNIKERRDYPARCSTPAARWWRRRRTSRYTSARRPCRCRRRSRARRWRRATPWC
ncbi:MAG: hydantoinase B/oxoprolinase family protein [Candidatus Binatia bacterium]